MDISAQTAAELLATAHALADAARPHTLAHFRQTNLTSDNKDQCGGFDPVTQADRAAEAAMRDILAVRRPEDGIFGEEHGQKTGSSGLTWVLDPIDGTRGYISGSPTWTVLIGLRDETGLRMGMIDQPYLGERFVGGFGTAQLESSRGPMPLATKQTANLSHATICSTFPEIGTTYEQAAFQRVAQNCQLTRYGMDGYAYGLLALGQIDLVVEAGLQAYDICGPIGVIEAAGGLVTNWQGGLAHEGGQVIAAANPALHEQALERLNQTSS